MPVKIANAEFVGKFSARLGYLVAVTRMLIMDGNYGGGGEEEVVEEE